MVSASRALRPIISVHDLGKQYRLGESRAPYGTFRETMMDWARSPLRMLRANGSAPLIWALNDVSFEVEPGEVVGIIGRNGAGKSTLLKILSRITDPTKGKVELFGRVASLSEVGTGFHPELTGRENIFLNGSILTMSRREIESKFDDIVAFAEIEKFIDTPVKRYSSGMYVRLAFAVAAFLEPEILMVDEVLAVGDAAFQKKCLGRMREVATAGRTVLFVSHNMAAVSALCSKAIVLRNGRVEFPLGSVSEAVQSYLAGVNEITQTRLAERTDRRGEGRIRISDFGCFDDAGSPLQFAISGQPTNFRIYFKDVTEELENVTVAIGITSYSGAFVTMLSNQLASEEFNAIRGTGYFECRIRKLPLSAGSYAVNLVVRANGIIEDWLQEAATFSVEAGDFYGTGRLPPETHGGILLEQEWDARVN